MNKFPYIKTIKVNDCYSYKDFNINIGDVNKFKHIILTGKNGSGKSTILKRINSLITTATTGANPVDQAKSTRQTLSSNLNHPSKNNWINKIKELSDVELFFDTFNIESSTTAQTERYNYFNTDSGSYIYTIFTAQRHIQLQTVNTVTKESDFLNTINNTSNFTNMFKQYLVNKKVYEAFDHMNDEKKSKDNSKTFFDNLTSILRSVFSDELLELKFIQESFEFMIILKDQREITFNQLSDGLSAFLSIIMDLLVRADLIRKKNKNNKLDPPGIVLIDEPECHFHLEMQYQILPLLTSLFPRIQFIIATHSPAIISSLENSIIYDISTKHNVSNNLTTTSYSELMINHFGLDNEFSSIADKIITEIEDSYKSKDIEHMQKILEKYNEVLTPLLRLEVESRIIDLEGRS